MMSPASLRRPVGTCVLAGYLLGTTGCQSWHTRQGDLATVIAPAPETSPGSGPGRVAGLTPVQPATTSNPDTVRHIRITTAQGTIELHTPRGANDSLYGQESKSSPESAFALADVTAVETSGFSAGKTTLLVGGVLAGALVVAVGALAAACDGTYGDC
jgi:hypothetical protein